MGVGDWISQHVFGQAPGTAGTSGAAGVNDPLAYDPSTGMFFDSKNGQYYQDQNGQMPVAGSNSVQQIGGDLGVSRGLLGQLGGYQAQQQAGFSGEQGLAHSLQNTINGGGPSVAQTQLGMGQDALAAQMMSQAAGVSGPGALAAQLAAMRGTAAGQIGVNQQAALLRAQEGQQAQQQLANVYGNMAQQGQAGYNANLQGGSNFANTAAGLAGGHEGNEEDRNKHNADFGVNLTKSLFGGASSGAAAAAPMM